MINKIKGLFKKLKKKKSSENDLDGSDFTSDIPIQELIEEDEDTLILEDKKPSIKEKFFDFKTKIADKINHFRMKRNSTTTKAKKEKKVVKVSNKFAKNINFANLHKELLARASRTKVHKVFQASFLLFSVFLLGKTTALLVKGKADFSKLVYSSITTIDESRVLQAKEVNEIRIANLFKTEASQPTEAKPKKKEVIKTNLACTKADRKSSLPIKLVNTVVLQDSVKSIASVQVRSERLFREIRVGEQINNMAKIDKIERLKLIVKNLKTGKCESIESAKKQDLPSPISVMSPSASKKYAKKLKPIKGIKNNGNKFEIEKGFMKEKMKDISKIVTEARGIQINNPDGTISFKIVDVVPGSIYSYLNIQNGDVITGIGGDKITDLNMVMGYFGKITTLEQTSITIKRGGQEVTQEYKFK